MLCGEAQAASNTHKPVADKQRMPLLPPMGAASALCTLPSMVVGAPYPCCGLAWATVLWPSSGANIFVTQEMSGTEMTCSTFGF
jgi:hypothetical protein